MKEESKFLSEAQYRRFCANIKAHRKHLNMTQMKLAKQLYISNKAVSRWELGEVLPTLDQIAGLCQVYDIFLDELCLGTDLCSSTKDNNELDFLRSFRRLDKRGQQVIQSSIDAILMAIEEDNLMPRANIKDFKQYLLPASAGSGSILDEGEDYEWISVYKRNQIADADMLIMISGDSMNPTFKNGQSVFIKKTHELFKGEIGVFILNGEFYIKEKGSNRLISHNKEYKDIKIKPSDCISVVGRVVDTLKDSDIVKRN